MTPILHHYPASPFAELIRAAMGAKGLEWRSVIVPNMMPKPGQTELTGGYGRTPVLQIGADIHCDSAAIIDALEAYGPSLYPAPAGAMHRIVASWAAGPQFLAHVGAAMGNLPPGALPQAFIDDRKARFNFDMSSLAKARPHLVSQVTTAAAWLDAMLADGRAFIGGDTIGHGDLALYANVWFVKSGPFAADAAAMLDGFPRLSAWFDRIAALGHGKLIDTSADQAIAIARDAQPAAITGRVGEGFTAGQPVRIKTEGSGDSPVAGRLARCDSSGIAVLRDSDGAGTIAVHFPRLGQIVIPD